MLTFGSLCAGYGGLDMAVMAVAGMGVRHASGACRMNQRAMYHRRARTITWVTVVPSVAALSLTIAHRSSGTRTLRMGVCVSARRLVAIDARITSEVAA